MILFTGCVSSQVKTTMVKLPHQSSGWQIQQKNTWPPPNNVSIVVRMFYREWKKTFGDKDQKVQQALDKIMIEWVDNKQEKILGYKLDGSMGRGTIRGATLTPTYIKVERTHYKRLAATALIHELVHIALWNSGKILGDPDHEGKDFEGWTLEHTRMIKKLNRTLANMNI